MATEMATRAFDSSAASIRLAGAAGLLGCALGVAGGIVVDLLDAPATTASAAEIVEFVEGDRTALLVGMLLSTAAVSLWFVFGAGVWLRLRERRPNWRRSRSFNFTRLLVAEHGGEQCSGEHFRRPPPNRRGAGWNSSSDS